MRPSGSTSSSKSARPIPVPCSAPAAREMFSSIRVPPRSSTPADEELAHAVHAQLHPRTLDVVDVARVDDPGHGVHQEDLTEGRSTAGLALEVDGRRHVHERQPHELGEPAGLALQVAGHEQVTRPTTGLLDGAEHDGHVGARGRRSERSGGPPAIPAVSTLSGHSTARTSSSRISAAVPGNDRRPASIRRRRYSAKRLAEALGTLGDLEGGEAVDVDARCCLGDGPGDIHVVVAVEVGVYAALEAHLGRTHRPGPRRLGRRCRRG